MSVMVFAAARCLTIKRYTEKVRCIPTIILGGECDLRGCGSCISRIEKSGARTAENLPFNCLFSYCFRSVLGLNFVSISYKVACTLHLHRRSSFFPLIHVTISYVVNYQRWGDVFNNEWRIYNENVVSRNWFASFPPLPLSFSRVLF